jgi:hypothetical protein
MESTIHVYKNPDEALQYAMGAGFEITHDKKGRPFAKRPDMEQDFILWSVAGGRCYWKRTEPRS